MKKKINQLKELVKPTMVKQKKSKNNEGYNVRIEWDYNDADYTFAENDFTKKEFEDDLGLLLMLIYFQRNPDHVEDQGNNLHSMLGEYNLMGYSDWGAAHSIEGITITFTDSNGNMFPFELELPVKFKDLTNEELIELCNSLFEEDLKMFEED